MAAVDPDSLRFERELVELRKSREEMLSELARRHHWDQQQKHWEAQQTHYKAQQWAWGSTVIVGLAGLLVTLWLK